jgi:hypothetical protein
LCYAKITPAALQRGELSGRRRESAEAAGRNPKFGSSVFPRIIAGTKMRPAQPRWLAST